MPHGAMASIGMQKKTKRSAHELGPAHVPGRGVSIYNNVTGMSEFEYDL